MMSFKITIKSDPKTKYWVTRVVIRNSNKEVIETHTATSDQEALKATVMDMFERYIEKSREP